MPKKKIIAKKFPAPPASIKPAEASRQPVTRCPKPVYDCLNCRMLLRLHCTKLRIDIDLGHPKQNCEYWRKPLAI